MLPRRLRPSALRTPSRLRRGRAAAEPARDPGHRRGKVGDADRHRARAQLAQDAFASELANVPQAQWRSVLIDAVVNMELLALAAARREPRPRPRLRRAAGVPEAAGAAQPLCRARDRERRHRRRAAGRLPDARRQGAQAGSQQVRARHILVDTKEEAEKIIEELKGGASFEELAKQSKDPSGQNGGDLGFFGAGQMVPEFEKAAFALEPGQFTQEPVKTQFGWHVIKVEEKRMSEPPAFADVEAQLRNYLIRQKFETVLAGLRDKYPVEIVDQPAAPAAPDDGAGGAGRRSG